MFDHLISKYKMAQITILVTYLGEALLREQLSVTLISFHECLFMQAVRSSVRCWLAHIDVHRYPDFWYLQRRVFHCLRQEQANISRQLSGMGLNDISTGCSPDSPSLHHISEGAGSSGVGHWAFLHIITCRGHCFWFHRLGKQ